MIENDFLENGYKEEVEYLYANDILNDLVIKIIWSKNKDWLKKIDELLQMVNSKYPNWYKNKIIKTELVRGYIFTFYEKNGILC